MSVSLVSIDSKFPLWAMKLTFVLALLIALANADEGSQKLRGAAPDVAGQEKGSSVEETDAGDGK